MGWASFQYFNRQKQRKHTGWQSPKKVDCRCGSTYTFYPNGGGYPDARKTHERSKKHLQFTGEWDDSAEKRNSDYKKLLNAREKARIKSIQAKNINDVAPQLKNTTNVAPQIDISDKCAPQIISSDIAAEDSIITEIAPQDTDSIGNSVTVVSKTKVAKSMKAKVTKAKVTKAKVTKAKVTKAKAKKVA